MDRDGRNGREGRDDDRDLEATNTRALVEQAQNGDRQAFSRLVDRCRRPLASWVHAHLGDRLRREVDVDDVLQESFLKAYGSIHRFRYRKAGSFRSWLAGIARHVIGDLARKHPPEKDAEKRPSSCLDGDVEPGFSQPAVPARGGVKPLAASDATPGQILRRQERFEKLEAVFATLSPDRRRVVTLALLEDLPIREVAARMGRTPDATSMLLLRTLRQLKLAFGHTESLHLPPRVLGPPPERDAARDSGEVSP